MVSGGFAPGRPASRAWACCSPMRRVISALVPLPWVSVRASRTSFSAGLPVMIPRPPNRNMAFWVTSMATSAACTRTPQDSCGWKADDQEYSQAVRIR